MDFLFVNFLAFLQKSFNDNEWMNDFKVQISYATKISMRKYFEWTPL